MAAGPVAWADDESSQGEDQSSQTLLGGLLGGDDESADEADESEDAVAEDADEASDEAPEEASGEASDEADNEAADEAEPADEASDEVSNDALLGDLLGSGEESDGDSQEEGDSEDSEDSGGLLGGDLLGGDLLGGDLLGGDLLGGDLLGGDLLGGDLLGGDLLGGGLLGDGGGPDTAWGTVIPNVPAPQSHAWLVRVDGIIADKAVFASHYPVMPDAPKVRSGGSELIRLVPEAQAPLIPAVGLGVASGAYTKAIGNAVSGNPGQMDLPYPGAAHAEAAATSIDVGVPYISNIIPGGKQLSLVGVHLEGVRVAVTSWRQRLKFSGMGPVAGYVSLLGRPLLEVPTDYIEPNLGIRLPEDRSEPALAEVVLNEQVTTDSDGKPTEDANGRYEFDPRATSGYANAAHVSVLGLNAIDVTVAHAAVTAKSPKKK
ncbi:hypothetical protein JOD67_005918 [Tenggerimyces flavus]|nr:hypothetical protein [Tenggerimyces flavus]